MVSICINVQEKYLTSRKKKSVTYFENPRIQTRICPPLEDKTRKEPSRAFHIRLAVLHKIFTQHSSPNMLSISFLSVTVQIGAVWSLAYYSAWVLDLVYTATNQKGKFLLFEIIEYGKYGMFFLKRQICCFISEKARSNKQYGLYNKISIFFKRLM